MKIKYTILFLASFLLLSSCKKEKQEQLTPNWEVAQNFYLKSITNSISFLDTLKDIGSHHPNSKKIFSHARQEFKKAEPYASYLNPPVGHRANGPALPIFKEDNEKVILPIGLQKIEESLYEGEVSVALFNREIELTKGLLTVLQKNIENKKLNPQRFFVATHQQLFRIVSLAISGFDTPVSKLGLNESITSLQSLLKVYEFSIKNIIIKKQKKLDTSFKNHIQSAINYLCDNPDFDSFDRFTFIRDYMNPITRDWVAIRKASNLWEGAVSYPFNFDAPTFFENNSWNIDFFLAANNRNATSEQIILGKKLFFEPKLSANGKMACATCHDPKKGYADGLTTSIDNNGASQLRNTPTLLNVAIQQSFFWDGRSETLRDQISEVFNNDLEFNSSVHQFSDAILSDSTYTKMFIDVFGKVPKRNTEVIKAITSYIATLNGFNSKFDKNIRGEVNTFTEEEKLGFNLFMGKALCATCHFMPLSNGTVPPFFKETEKEVIGVPNTAKNKELDDDLGFYWKYNHELQKGMFKTPTVRNIAVTAPYMHNGVYTSLEEVVDFYNKGGGGGLGFELEHQTLPFDNLQLTDKEQKAIVAFMKTLTDEDV